MCRVVRSLWLGIKFLQCPIAPRVFQNMSHMPVGTHVVIRGQQNPGVIKEAVAHMAVVELQLPIDDLEEAPLAAATDSTDRAITILQIQHNIIPVRYVDKTMW